MNRRNFLTSSVVATGALALAGCTTLKGMFHGTAQQITEQVLNDSKIIANSLGYMIPVIGDMTKMSQSTMTDLTNAAKDAATAAGDMAAHMTQTEAQPLVARIEGDVQLFMTDLSGFMANPRVKGIMDDVQILLPMVMTAVGLLLPAGTAKASSPAEVAAARARLAALPKVALH